MIDPIVSRLHKSKCSLFESDRKRFINEVDDDDEDDLELDDEPSEDEDDEDEEDPEMSDPSPRPPRGNSEPPSSPEEEYEDEEGQEEKPRKKLPKSPNPLDNQYAVEHTLGDEVVLVYTNGTASEIKAKIEGYDSEGFYRLVFSDGSTMNGITDLALADDVSDSKDESCVCGGTDYVEENNKLVCDKCGRIIKENLDHLTNLDKKRPKGRRMIRSEVHPMTTAKKPAIEDVGVE